VKSSTHRTAKNRRRSAYLAAAGALVFASQVGCSDDPVTNNPGSFAGTSNNGTAGNTTNTTAGTGGTGTTTGGAGGSFSAGGTTAGTGGATGGSFTAGGTTAGSGGATGGTGGATGGTAGTAAGGGGTGGTGVVIPPPPAYCVANADSAVPFEVTTAFYASGWYGLNSQISVFPSDENVAANNCLAPRRATCAIGGCSRWRFTPDAAAPSWAAVAWVNRADANYTHEPICLPTGVKRISFFARGAVGGEVVAFGGAGVMEQPITLTAEWKEYSIDLTGVDYNNADAGVPSGLSWKVEPGAGQTAPVLFDIDNIRFVTTDAPAANAPLCPGGGGAGGAGGAGGGGAGGGGAGGAGAGGGGTGGGGAGGTGGAGAGGGGAGGTN
jgi:hypothetical protein